jgi:hypothetical protein
MPAPEAELTSKLVSLRAPVAEGMQPTTADYFWVVCVEWRMVDDAGWLGDHAPRYTCALAAGENARQGRA